MSNKVNPKEMLEILDGVCLYCKDGTKKCPNEYCRNVIKAIRALILDVVEEEK